MREASGTGESLAHSSNCQEARLSSSALSEVGELPAPPGSHSMSEGTGRFSEDSCLSVCFSSSLWLLGGTALRGAKMRFPPQLSLWAGARRQDSGFKLETQT